MAGFTVTTKRLSIPILYLRLIYVEGRALFRMSNAMQFYDAVYWRDPTSCANILGNVLIDFGGYRSAQLISASLELQVEEAGEYPTRWIFGCRNAPLYSINFQMYTRVGSVSTVRAFMTLIKTYRHLRPIGVGVFSLIFSRVLTFHRRFQHWGLDRQRFVLYVSIFFFVSQLLPTTRFAAPHETREDIYWTEMMFTTQL